MTNLARISDTAIEIGERYGFEREKTELIKSQIAQGASDGELALFLYTAQRVRLDPLAKQIYCIMRTDRGQQKMTIQTGIDGYRLIADRTGNYAPGRANTFEYDDQARLVSATAYVMKHVRGQWLEASATAYWDEYVALNRDGQPQSLWKTKPRVMLGKCAEALALRRAFPAELSGIYTSDEMESAGNGVIVGEVIDQRPQPRQLVAVNPLAQEAFDLQCDLYALDTSFIGKSLERLGTFDEQKLMAYCAALEERIAKLKDTPEPEGDAPRFAEQDTTPDTMSETQRAFWDRYGEVIGTNWQDIQRFYGALIARPATDDEWRALDADVNTRLNREAAQVGA